jgi:hypothetical protein
LSSSEISEGIGPVGFFGISRKSDTHPQSGAKASIGISWTNFNKFYKVAEKIWMNIDKEIPKELIDEVIACSFKTPESLKQYIELYQVYIDKFIEENNDKISNYFYSSINSIQLNLDKELQNNSNINEDLIKLNKFVLSIKENSLSWNEIEKDIVEIAKSIVSGIGKKYLFRIQFAITSENNRDSLIALQNTFKDEGLRNLYARFILFGETKSEEIEKMKDDFIQNKMEKKIFKVFLGFGSDYNSIKYLDPYNEFKEEENSYTGIFATFSSAYFFNSNSIVYFKCEYGKFGKAPTFKTIIQNMSDYNGKPIATPTWIQRQAFLEKLEIKNEISPSIHFRNYFGKSFALEPFVSLEIDGKKINETKIAMDALFSLDNDKKWLMGIQPNITWTRDSKSNQIKGNVGLFIYLSKNFNLGKE